MRTIKFRGLDFTDQWRYGHFTIDASGRHVIWTKEENWEVKPESVGQFIGLISKNLEEIYEEDIVQFVHEANGYIGRHKPRIVKYVQGRNRNGFNIADGFNYEVIGNIYENPELIK